MAYIDSDNRLVERVRQCKKLSDEHLDEWLDGARENYDMVAGHQWDEITKAEMVDQLRPVVTFNLTGKFVDVVNGLQINNREDIQYFPREQGDVQVNEILTSAGKWVRDQCDAEDEETESFFDMLVCGMGWTETFLDDDERPEGDIRTERRDPLHMRYDPAARKRNIRDARWIMRINPMRPVDVQERWPEQYDDITPSEDWDVDDDMPDEIHNATDAWKYEDNAVSEWTQHLIPVVEYQWWEREVRYRVSTQLGTQEFDQEEYRRIRKMAEQTQTPIRAVPIRRKVYYRAFIAGETVLEKRKSPYQEGFTYQCMTGKRDRNNNTWYGVVAALKDPQKWTNKFFSQILHILNNQAKGGVIAQRGLFEDDQEAEWNWARSDSVIYTQNSLHDDHGKPKLMPKPQAEFPSGLHNLFTWTTQSLPEVSGLNLEMLGLANREQAGVLEMTRKEAGMSVIAWAFDSLRRYHKDNGRMLARYIQNYISDGRLIRIIGDDGNQRYVPLVRQSETLEFDVIVDEAPTSTNQREKVWMVMQSLLPQLLQAGIPVPPQLLDYAPIPEKLAQAWKQHLQPSPEEQRSQQEQQRIAMQTAQAELEKTQTETQEMLADIRKTLAEISKLRAETGETETQSMQNVAEAHKTAAEAGQTMAGGQ